MTSCSHQRRNQRLISREHLPEEAVEEASNSDPQERNQFGEPFPLRMEFHASSIPHSCLTESVNHGFAQFGLQ